MRRWPQRGRFASPEERQSRARPPREELKTAGQLSGLGLQCHSMEFREIAEKPWFVTTHGPFCHNTILPINTAKAKTRPSPAECAQARGGRSTAGFQRGVAQSRAAVTFEPRRGITTRRKEADDSETIGEQTVQDGETLKQTECDGPFVPHCHIVTAARATKQDHS